MNTEKTPWDFVELYYPNYSTSEEIAHNNDLKALLDGEEEEGSKAWKIKQEIIKDYRTVFPYHSYDEREEYRMMVEEEIKNRYNESCKSIYEKAIEGYLESQKDIEEITMTFSISDIDQCMEDNDIQFPLSEYGKIKILKHVKENFDANASYWDNILEGINFVISNSAGGNNGQLDG